MKRPTKVLHVDDSLLDIELVRDALEREAGYFIIESVRTRAQFERSIENNAYDVILSDFNILGFDGLQVIDIVHKQIPDTPVIIVTGTGSEEIAVEAMKRGAADYVIKHPSHIQKLPHTIRRVIEKCEAQRRHRESEERYRTAVEHSNDGFALVRGERHVYVNRKFLEIFGYDTIEEINGNPPYSMVHPDDRDMVIDYSLRRQKGKDVPDRYEYKGIRKDGETIYVEVSATSTMYNGEPVVLAYLHDITMRKINEENLRKATEKLRKSLIGTIQAMSLTVESKDPYTAGHQKRVSNLARVIAQEMGLSKDASDTIRMAGSIHDIGKISIPAEILSKPTQLTEIEFSLIKMHPQSGYDIIKDTELPHPMAEIVLQHHERINGSGYPNGLEGDEILLEARILAVADVVEAISSHRPYRASLGLDAALEEIEKNRAMLYYERAVDICLKLFREEGFRFEQG